MNWTKQFIHRPVLSSVLALLIVFMGLISLYRLPMTLFPPIAPPEVNVTVEYTGANAETVVKSAIVPLERAINGVPNMKYMSSDAGNDGVGVVQILFETGTDPDIASVNVQNRVSAVMGELPAEVIRNGVKIAKEENALLMYLNVYSTDTTLDEKFLYNYADINLLAEIKRIKGVGYADILGAKEYAMRVWLKPDKLKAYALSVQEVLDAIENQNLEAAPGKLGENSDRNGLDMQYTIRYRGKFNTEEAYRTLPVKSGAEGEILRLKDVADIEFGTTYFDVEAKLNGRPCAAIALKQLPRSNASEVIEAVKAKMNQLKATSFLPGMDYEVSYDVSRFLDASIHEVYKTLIEAFILVALVVFLFLQDWRLTLIPSLTVPVALIGALFFVFIMGFSLNMITLFALVLAIGIVIDDSIVVVEAVHAKMEAYKLTPRRATELAMKEIAGAIVGITLVMSAVFVPVSFMTGPAGVFFKQFSLTLAFAIVLSGVVALTLTPALCVLLLKPHTKRKRDRLGVFFILFNRWYSLQEGSYLQLLKRVLHRRLVIIGSLVVFCIAVFLLSKVVPMGFIPNEDQGSFYASVTTPSGATLERTKAIMQAIQQAGTSIEGVESISTLSGTNILSDGTGASYGTALINLKPWDQRKATVLDIIDAFERKTAWIKDARIEFFPPPAVPGYGNASGFELRLLDKSGSGDFQYMDKIVRDFLDSLKQYPEIASAFTVFDASYPQYQLHIDLDKAAQKGVSVSDALGMLQTLLGSEYASNFIRFGQLYKVMVQALPEYRALPEDILRFSVKNKNGDMVALSSFVTLEKTYGVDQLTRYNMYPSAEINGEGKPGISSGTVLTVVQQAADKHLPRGFEIDWAGISRDEVNSGGESAILFVVCLLFVYLLLSAQYESYLLPLPVILSLPCGLLGSFFFLYLFGLENNLYAQIAMLMLIGLLGKNAILIVEFATQRRREGVSPANAALLGAKARLRPILMTSFAFIAGLLPLVFASGAGAVGNQTIGVTAAGGMLIGTLFGVIVIPGLFLLVSGRFTKS